MSTPTADPHTDAPRWRTTVHLAAGVLLGTTLLALGVLFRRPDVALLGLAPLLGAVWGWTHRPHGPVTVRVVLDTDAPAGTLAARTVADVPPGVELLRLRAVAPGGLVTERLVDATHGPRELTWHAPSARTGVTDTLRVDYAAYGPDGVEEQVPRVARGPRRLVLPRPTPLGHLPLASRLRGLSGPHTSRRPGDGTELRDVDAFRPGDRLRRIDWRATARRSPTLDTLYVRRTFGTAEATVVLVVDSRDEVAPDLATWSGVGAQRPDEATSLDLARHAAASVAQAVLAEGDRVALDDLGRLARPVRPGGGRRHLRRILHGLALARPDGDPSARHRPPQVPAGAAVYLFSTLLDDEAPRLARQWHDTGHVVVVVDVLPPVSLAEVDDHVATAWAVTRHERADRMHDLRERGVVVARWYDGTRGADGARETLELAARRLERQGSGRPSPTGGTR
ncbi:hypothetical protein CBR64_18575 [Cellulosimicrobium cellulans]|uniref:DUF58 domain-containing protein n=1 Tax=Cellulosimicrobium cellulans TaxID=1710 RepID=A0A1Y0I0S5_CELCE|nr:DUF58 domain-containing protein [Cellulosimicrobium cellulans]ARU53145.1 hypothetical protein CBR64_18575 [Cellulosimicrobium cellulans]